MSFLFKLFGLDPKDFNIPDFFKFWTSPPELHDELPPTPNIIHFDFAKSYRRNVEVQAGPSLDTFISASIETDISVPVNYKPSIETEYKSATGKTIIIQQKSIEKHANSSTSTEQSSPTVTSSDHSEISEEETKEPVSIPPPKKEVKETTLEPPKIDTFSSSNFQKKIKADPEPDTFAFTNFKKPVKTERELDTFSFTNFKPKKQETDVDSFSFNPSAPSKTPIKAKPVPKPQSTSDDDSESSESSYSKGKPKEKSPSTDVFAFTNFKPKEPEPEEDNFTFKPSGAQVEEKAPEKTLTKIEEYKLKMEKLRNKSNGPTFSTRISTDLSRSSRMSTEQGGFSYTPYSRGSFQRGGRGGGGNKNRRRPTYDDSDE